MKTILSISVVLIFIFSSCNTQNPLIKGKAQNNKSYEVDYLFEHDGCKVYRFLDNGKYIYFTNCTGNVTSATTDSTKVYMQTMVKGK